MSQSVSQSLPKTALAPQLDVCIPGLYSSPFADHTASLGITSFIKQTIFYFVKMVSLKLKADQELSIK